MDMIPRSEGCLHRSCGAVRGRQRAVVLHPPDWKRAPSADMSQVKREWHGGMGWRQDPRQAFSLWLAWPSDTNWGVLGPARDVFDGPRRGQVPPG